MTADDVKSAFEGRIVVKLEELAQGLERCADDITDMTDEEYTWLLVCEDCDVEFTISEAATYGDDGGFNFCLTVVGDDGRVYAQVTPYNYTKEVWTEDMLELEQRWADHFAAITADDIKGSLGQ